MRAGDVPQRSLNGQQKALIHELATDGGILDAIFDEVRAGLFHQFEKVEAGGLDAPDKKDNARLAIGHKIDALRDVRREFVKVVNGVVADGRI